MRLQKYFFKVTYTPEMYLRYPKVLKKTIQAKYPDKVTRYTQKHPYAGSIYSTTLLNRPLSEEVYHDWTANNKDKILIRDPNQLKKAAYLSSNKIC